MNVRIEQHPGHLLVTASGDFDLQRARAGLGEALRQAQASSLTRLLVDGRDIGDTVSIADRYDLATQLAGAPLPGLRVAIVVAPRNMFTKTLEDTARNRGIPLLSTDSMEAARAFLALDPA
jgi:hypothetical protein